jgi:hypothetical protein
MGNENKQVEHDRRTERQTTGDRSVVVVVSRKEGVLLLHVVSKTNKTKKDE